MPFRSYRSLLFNFLTFCVIEPPLGGLETTYDVHLGLIGKCVDDFLLVLIELFSLGHTAEALRTKIDRKSVIFFVFTQRNFIADFLQAKCDLGKNGRFAFLNPPLGDLGATYGNHRKLIGKRVVDFLLVLIELFSLSVTAEALHTSDYRFSDLAVTYLRRLFPSTSLIPVSAWLSGNVNVCWVTNPESAVERGGWWERWQWPLRWLGVRWTSSVLTRRQSSVNLQLLRRYDLSPATTDNRIKLCKLCLISHLSFQIRTHKTPPWN